MEYILESSDIKDYLKSDKYIIFYNNSVHEKADELLFALSSERKKIKAAYEFVRDEINHSGDIDS